MQTQAQIFKTQGNDEFQKGNYEKAIEFYTKAIQEDNTQSIFHSNRGKCYYLQKQYNEAYEDALIAVELDDKNIKAHLLSGQTICMLAKEKCDSQKIDTAIARLIKSRTLCAGQKKSAFEKEIDEKINKAKKMKWFIQLEENRQKNAETIKQLQDLVAGDKQMSQQEKQITLDQIQKYILIENKKLEIPEYLQCKISHKLLLDPYTTSTGYSYEKSELFKYSNVVTIDPFTKQQINPNQIFQNINLKQAAEDYLMKNPWAYDYSVDQTIKNIEL